MVLGSGLAEQAGDPRREDGALVRQRPEHVHQDVDGRLGVRAVGCEGRGDDGQQPAGGAAGNADAQPTYGFQRLPGGVRAPARRPPRFFGDVQQCRHDRGDLLIGDELSRRADDLCGRGDRAAERQGEEVPHIHELAEPRRVPGCLLALSRCGKNLHRGGGLVGTGEHVAEQPQVDHLLAQVPCQPGLSQAPPRVLEGIRKVAVVRRLERGQGRLAGPGEQPFLVRKPLGYLGEIRELGGVGLDSDVLNGPEQIAHVAVEAILAGLHDAAAPHVDCPGSLAVDGVGASRPGKDQAGRPGRVTSRGRIVNELRVGGGGRGDLPGGAGAVKPGIGDRAVDPGPPEPVRRAHLVGEGKDLLCTGPCPGWAFSDDGVRRLVLKYPVYKGVLQDRAGQQSRVGVARGVKLRGCGSRCSQAASGPGPVLDGEQQVKPRLVRFLEPAALGGQGEQAEVKVQCRPAEQPGQGQPIQDLEGARGLPGIEQRGRRTPADDPAWPGKPAASSSSAISGSILADHDGWPGTASREARSAPSSSSRTRGPSSSP